MIKQMKRENLSIMKGQQDRSSNKKEYFHETYICNCQKEYRSFPALYLHNKMKHGTVLSISWKGRMTKKTVWSGTRKILVYQFPQDSQEEKKPILSSEKRISIQQNKKGCSFNKHLIEPELLSFIDYIQQNNTTTIHQQFVLNSKTVINDLMSCCERNWGQIVQMASLQNQQAKQSYLNALPYSFNYFMVYWIHISSSKQISQDQIKQILLELSNWLYNKNYTIHLAVKNQELQ